VGPLGDAVSYSYDYRFAALGLADAKKFAVKYGRILGVRELPVIKVRNNLGAKWLGRLSWTPGKPTVMELQKDIFEDEETLERVVAHEMCHHVEMLEYEDDEEVKAKLRLGIQPPEHGPRWKELANKVNAVAGANFVTKTSDQSYVMPKKTKPFVLLVAPTSGPNLGYAVGVRLSPKMKRYVERYQQNYDGKLIQTTDPRWADGPRIGNGFAMPRDPEGKSKLRDLYDAAA
jgi:hypothetical protein